MNGFDRLREELKEQDPDEYALKEVVDYLLTRKDMEPKYLNEEKSLVQMRSYIRSKSQENIKGGWDFIPNEVVFAWAIMYYSLPNVFLKINQPKATNKPKSKSKESSNKNNVVSIEKVKKVLEEKKQVDQLTLFGGVAQ